MKTRSEAKREKQHNQTQEKLRDWQINVPNDPINEQVILNAMVLDSETRGRLVKTFTPEAFYSEQHRMVFAALQEIERRRFAYDPATVARINPEIDIRMLEKIEAVRSELPENIKYHTDMLSWDALLARAARGPMAAFLDAFQSADDPARIKALARAVGDAFEGTTGTARYLRDPKEVVREAMTVLKKRAEGEAHYPYGIDTLDFYENGKRRLRPGASPGTIAMITALSGSGKSSLAGHFILGSARQHFKTGGVPRKVLVGAWEEESRVTIELLAVLALGWSRSRVLDGESNRLRDDGRYEPLNHEEMIQIEDMMDRISKHVRFFENAFQRGSRKEASNEGHLDLIQEHIEASGCDVFIADLFARCLVDDSPSGERAALFRFLQITQDLNIHSIIVHQQRAKDIENRVDKRPTREGIIGSGAWLDVCWSVFAPHIPAKWKKVPDDKLELYILKQRNGPWPLAVEFEWDPDTGQIDNGKSLAVEVKGETDEISSVGAKRKGRQR